MIGFFLLSYIVIQGLFWVIKVVHGDRNYTGNLFKWGRVRRNIQGGLDCPHTLAWVSEVIVEAQ